MIAGKDYVGVGCWGTIINEKNETLLIKRKNKELWERPGGKLEVGESFENCLIREIKEETNINIIPDLLLLVEQIYDPKKDSHWICIGYLCKYKSGQPKLLEDDKHEKISWFTVDNLPPITKYTKNALEKHLSNKR